MGFYDEEDSAESYIKMAKGSDGGELIAELKQVLMPESSVLEIGMGPGVDLDLLSDSFSATGSDSSPYFIERYHSMHPKADLLILDAVSLSTKRSFDAIYSNKVLHHLNDKDLVTSFVRQSEILNKQGIIMHSFWNGDGIEEHQGLMFHNRTSQKVADLLGSRFSILAQRAYGEFDPGDSHWLLARHI